MWWTLAAALAAEPYLNSAQLDLGLAVAGVAYERELAPWVSARGAVQLTSPWYTGVPVVGVSAELRPFFFPWRGPHWGVYASPFARVAGIRSGSSADTPTVVGWTAGATAGAQWLWSRLLLRFGGGAQYWSFVPSQGVGLVGVWPDADIIVGYRF